MKIFIFLLFCVFILSVFILLCFFLSYSFFFFSGVPSSPFECGFSPMVNSMFLFSMPFFLISIMFLLFDVEILLLCFYPIFFSMGGLVSIFSMVVIFMVSFATFYEWFMGVISWI